MIWYVGWRRRLPLALCAAFLFAAAVACNTPTPTATIAPTVAASSTVSNTPTATITATATLTPTATTTTTATPTPTLISSATLAATATLRATATRALLPTWTPAPRVASDTPVPIEATATQAIAPSETPTPLATETLTPGPRVRIGALCNDGTSSNATGRGACSSHGGVKCWKYSDGTCTNP